MQKQYFSLVNVQTAEMDWQNRKNVEGAGGVLASVYAQSLAIDIFPADVKWLTSFASIHFQNSIDFHLMTVVVDDQLLRFIAFACAEHGCAYWQRAMCIRLNAFCGQPNVFIGSN